MIDQQERDLNDDLDEVARRAREQMHESAGETAELLERFKFRHLPEHLRAPSVRFAELAIQFGALSPSWALVETLRRMWEAKNAAVIAHMRHHEYKIGEPDGR